MSTLSAEPRDAFWRSLHALNVTRIIIAGLLLVLLSFSINTAYLPKNEYVFHAICLVYLALAVLFSAITVVVRSRFMLQLLSQVVVDIVIISMLYLVAGGMKSGLAILYLFPLTGAAILVQMVLALFFASAATLFLLAESWYRIFKMDAETQIMQAGLYGASFFAAVFLVNRLAAKLISQENLAMKRGLDLEMQQAINRLVIADMDDGVLVVGSDSTIFSCNPSAEKKLHLHLQPGLHTLKLINVPYLKPLADALFLWDARRLAQSENDVSSTAFLMIKPAERLALPNAHNPEEMASLAVHFKVRFAMAMKEALPEDRIVIFLQDVASIENQAQELKLASMGRLTASIAHEVRNPLAAIAHASALLGEDVINPAQKRLLSIVADNVARMDQMVEDILNLSRKGQSQNVIFLPEIIDDIKSSFEETHSMPKGVIQVSGETDGFVRFDPLHLREVLLNLLTNAIRYASGRIGSIRIKLMIVTLGQLELHVQDDGPSISAEVRAHLFEPFYTTSSKGTGLGLYLARELCLNNGAMLDYEFHTDDYEGVPGLIGGRFVITFVVQDMAMSIERTAQ